MEYALSSQIEVILVITAMILCLNSSYTTRIMARGVDTGLMLSNKNIAGLYLGALTLPTFVLTVVWAFINLNWYIPVITFIVGSVILNPVLFIRPVSVLFWFRLQTAFNFISVIIVTTLWYHYIFN